MSVKYPSPWNDELQPGAQIGRYQILELLAMGGMAEIYLVKSVGMQGFETRSVLKRLPPSSLMSEPSAVGMFFDEARLVASLRHPNIAQVFDIGQDEESFFFVMEYLDGIDIRELIQRCRKGNIQMPLEMAIQIVLGVAEGVHAAHEACSPEGEPLNIVHRDVSPNNIIVTRDGAVKVIDFGIAKSSEGRARTEAGVIKGKFAYMSPEQCLSEPLDRRSDLFALGVILYELTTARRPHGITSGPELLHRIAFEDCPDPRDLCSGYPDDLAQIVMQLLEREPGRRFDSARDFHRALSMYAAQHRMLLSPYELATWIEELQLSTAATQEVPRLSTFIPNSTRANTIPMCPSPSPESTSLHGFGRLAHGTEPPESQESAMRSSNRRMTSLPYLEIGIDSSSTALDEEETEGDELVETPTRDAGAGVGRWLASAARVAGLTSVLAAAAIVGGVHLIGADLSVLVAFLQQLSG